TAQPVPRRADDDRLVNVQLGTWKLNLRKSRLPSGAIRSMTTTFAKTTSGDLSVTTDVVEGNGRRIHYEWRGKVDGTDYPLVGDESADSRAYSEVDDHTLAITVKKAGKILGVAHSIISADGKSSTGTLTGTDSSGKILNLTVVFERVR